MYNMHEGWYLMLNRSDNVWGVDGVVCGIQMVHMSQIFTTPPLSKKIPDHQSQQHHHHIYYMYV